MPLVLSASGITNAGLAPNAGVVQVVSATSGGYTVTNNFTWLTLGTATSITPTKTGNRIVVTAQYVYPKETANFMNVNNYRLRYGSNYVTMCSESFAYSDPYTHQYMTAQGFAQYVFTVASGEVNVAQTISIEWNSGNGSFDVGTYLSNGATGSAGNIAVRVTAWECA